MPVETLEKIPAAPSPKHERVASPIPLLGYKLLDFLAREKGLNAEKIVAKTNQNDPIRQEVIVDFVYLAETSPEPLTREQVLGVLQRKSLPEYCIVRLKDRITEDWK